MRFSTFLVTSFLSGFSIAAFAAPALKDCRIYDVNEKNNVWEEGLGEFGHPSSDSDSQTLSVEKRGSSISRVEIGQGGWGREENDIVSKKLDDGSTTIYIMPKDRENSVYLSYYDSGRGSIWYQTVFGRPKYGFVAKFDCSSVAAISKMEPTSKGATRLTKEQLRTMPTVVRDRLRSFDIAYEMGDGYYDVTSEEFYAVHKNGELLGYIYGAHLNYSEGEPTYAIVRFDRNGLPLRETMEELGL